MKAFATASLMVLLAAGSSPAQFTNLDARVSVESLPKWDYKDLVGFLGSRAGYAVVISSNALDRAMTNRYGDVGFDGRFDNISVRDALSWTLSFASVSATITNSTLFILTANDAPCLPADLRPVAGQRKPLPASSVTVNVKDGEWEFRQLLLFLCRKAGLNYVFDPSIVTNRITLQVSFQDTPIREAVETALEKAGAECHTHGEILYFRLRQESAQHGVGR